MVFIERVSKKDSRLLIKWWNANTKYYYTRIKVGKLWSVVRQ